MSPLSLSLSPNVFAPTRLRATRPSDFAYRIRMALGPDADATLFSTYEDVSHDVVDSYGVSWNRGNQSSGPNDRLAETGRLQFVLNNSSANRVRQLGHWSPGHRTSRRLGWDIGVPTLLEIAFQGEWSIEWVGRVTDIEVEGGWLGTRAVHVTAKDWMEEAAQHQISGLAILDGVRADEIITAIIAAVAVPPPGGTLLDEGPEIFPLAFDDIRDDETTAVTELAKVLRSGMHFGFVNRRGAFQFQSRYSRINDNLNLFTLHGTMRDGIRTMRSRDDIVNRINVTVRPRDVSATFAVLWRSDSQDFVAAGDHIEYRVDFVDQISHENIGAIDVQVPVASLDYAMGLTATSSGNPDTPFTAVPIAAGHYSDIPGSIATLADSDDSTGITPSAAFQYTTFEVSKIATPPAAPNARITGVLFAVQVRHNSSNSHVNWHVRTRLNAIDSDIFGNSTGENANSGLYEWSVALATAPGGGDWTVAAFNAAEFGSAFNWSSAAPTWVRATVTLVYSSQVDDSDRTDDFAVTLTSVSGQSAVIRFENTGGDGAFVLFAQLRGRPIHRIENKTTFVEDAASIAQFGRKAVNVDMSYQSDVNAGASACAYLLALFANAIDRPGAVAFLANLSDEHMRAAIRHEIGDRIGLSESVTGLSATTLDGGPLGWHIVGVAGSIAAGGIFERTWYVGPADPALYFRAGIDEQDQVDGDAVVGPL